MGTKTTKELSCNMEDTILLEKCVDKISSADLAKLTISSVINETQERSSSSEELNKKTQEDTTKIAIKTEEKDQRLLSLAPPTWASIAEKSKPITEEDILVVSAQDPIPLPSHKISTVILGDEESVMCNKEIDEDGFTIVKAKRESRVYTETEDKQLKEPIVKEIENLKNNTLQAMEIELCDETSCMISENPIKSSDIQDDMIHETNMTGLTNVTAVKNESSPIELTDMIDMKNIKSNEPSQTSHSVVENESL